MAFIAQEMHTNRFYEFVQGDDPRSEVGLRSVFDEPRAGYENRVFDSRVKDLCFDSKQIDMWREYFGRFAPLMRESQKERALAEI